MQLATFVLYFKVQIKTLLGLYDRNAGRPFTICNLTLLPQDSSIGTSLYVFIVFCLTLPQACDVIFSDLPLACLYACYSMYCDVLQDVIEPVEYINHITLQETIWPVTVHITYYIQCNTEHAVHAQHPCMYIIWIYKIDIMKSFHQNTSFLLVVQCFIFLCWQHFHYLSVPRSLQ